MFKNTTQLYKLLKERSKNHNKLPELYNIRDIDCCGNIISFFVDEDDGTDQYSLKIRHIVDERHGTIFEFVYDDEGILLESEAYENVDVLTKQFDAFRKTISKYAEA